MGAPKGNTYAKGNKGGGNKTKYKKEYVEWAEKFAKLGATDKEVADFLDVGVATIDRWKKAHKEFSIALKRGKAFADANVANRLYQRAMGYEHPEEKIFNNQGEIVRADTIKHYPPDSTAAIFWLKNRQSNKWRDKQHHEHSGDEDNPIVHTITRKIVNNEGS